MGNPQLEELLKQKQQLDQRTDLSPEEKDKIGRRLRREIRKLGGTVRVLKDPGATYEPHSTGAKGSSTSSSDFPESGRSARYQKKEFKAYKEDLIASLLDLQLEWKEVHEILHVPTSGYSFALMYEIDASAELLIEKFKIRWSQQSPLWFSVAGNDTGEYLVLGPLPVGMVH